MDLTPVANGGQVYNVFLFGWPRSKSYCFVAERSSLEFSKELEFIYKEFGSLVGYHKVATEWDISLRIMFNKETGNFKNLSLIYELDSDFVENLSNNFSTVILTDESVLKLIKKKGSVVES